jgi:3'-5' exonuclease
MNSVIVWDLEMVPDLRGFSAANDLEGKTDDEIREAMGDKFPKHIYHSIACIGALIAHRDNDHWVVDALGAPKFNRRFAVRDCFVAYMYAVGVTNKPQPP